MFIALDDTDSRERMCTTYLTTLILRKFKENLNIDMPNLVRLNPNIPYKTRGNGACWFHINENLNNEIKEEIKAIVLDFLKKYSRFEDENTNPACVFLEDIKNLKHNFYKIKI